jgi:hypothetical protein
MCFLNVYYIILHKKYIQSVQLKVEERQTDRRDRADNKNPEPH